MFSDLVIGYLFFGGAGAGSCFLLSLISLLELRTSGESVAKDRFLRNDEAVAVLWSKILGSGFILALVMVFVGAFCLIMDLGRADDALLVFLFPTLSFLSVGSYSLLLLLLCALASACIWNSAIRPVSRIIGRCLAVSCLLCSLVVISYTGLLLGSLKAVPLWSGWWTPALFILSSLSCGIALAMVCSQFIDEANVLVSSYRIMVTIDAALIACELIVVAITVSSILYSGLSPAIESVKMFLFGEYSAVFWALFAGVGLVVPLASELYLSKARRFNGHLAMLAGCCVLVGGFALRLVWVQTAMHPDVVNSLAFALA